MSFIPIPISGLLDGKFSRTLSSETVFEQDGITFKGDSRPNPPNTHYVNSESQLKLALGPDQILPAGIPVTIVIEESFATDTPIKVQNDTSLLLYSESSNVQLNYIGPGEFIQMNNPGVDIAKRVQVSNVTLGGNFTNQCFAVETSEFFTIELSTITSFAKVGFIKGAAVIFRETAMLGNLNGIDFIECITVTFSDSSGRSFGVTAASPITLINFITTLQTDVVFRNSVYVSLGIPDEFIFIDPNMLASGSVTVRDSGGIFAPFEKRLFQAGIDETVTAVADNGSGKLRCTVVGHTQVDSTYTVLSGFSESSYNRTALVTVIDANTFDLEDIVFVPGLDSGNVNRSSLDSFSIPVSAIDNPDQRDSMFTAEAGLEVFGSEVSTVLALAQNQASIITTPLWEFKNLERFISADATIGELQAKDSSTREYNVQYSATIEKQGGGSTNIGIILFKNDLLTNEVSFNPPHTVNSGKIQISSSDIIELSQDDKLTMAVKNYDSTSAVILTSQAKIVISKG